MPDTGWLPPLCWLVGVAAGSHQGHLSRVLREYVTFFNHARPHQSLDQGMPEPSSSATGNRERPVRAVPVLGGPHHDYRRTA